PGAAAEAHAQGLRRLAMLVNAKAVKYLQRNLPGLREMSLIYTPLAPAETLQEDLLALILEQCCFTRGYAIRREEDFAAAMQQAKNLMPTANRVCQQAQRIFTAYQAARQQFQSVQERCSAASRKDIRAQFDALVYPGFLHHTPYQWLEEMPRYFRALTVRLEKLAAAPAGDEQKYQQLQPFLQEYARLKTAANTAQDNTQGNRELITLRWMLEEYRVSLFAQPMKTAVPVSPKRLEKQLARCR
ncbi:MAG TPA: DUF3418 domain-containing protein, partial [Gammaproteobacteria bacterium]|nr:DUF3418 domain-containing protein [Gammaproteobacteria bacterium]